MAAPPLGFGHKLDTRVGQIAIFFYYNQVLGLPGTLSGAALMNALLLGRIRSREGRLDLPRSRPRMSGVPPSAANHS